MARRVVFKTTAVTDAGIPFTVRVQYNPEYSEYRLTCFTAACTNQQIEDRACYTDDKEDAMSTIHHMQAEFRRNHIA